MNCVYCGRKCKGHYCSGYCKKMFEEIRKDKQLTLQGLIKSNKG